MALEDAIVSMLTDDAGVSALVGSRIHPQPAPHGVGAPFLTYQTISVNGSGHTFNDGKAAFEETIFQIDCWAEDETNPASAVQVRDVGAAVRSALTAKGSKLAGVEIMNIAFNDQRDLAEAQFRRRQLDFSIWTKGI